MERKENKVSFKEFINLFMNFLNENNASRHYLMNVRNYNERLGFGWTASETVIYYMNPFLIPRLHDYCIFNSYPSGHSLINMSFHWASTPQGHTFWSELDKKWNKIVDEMMIKVVKN